MAKRSRNSSKKNKVPPVRSGTNKRGLTPAWLEAIKNPSITDPTGIPDDNTRSSFKYSSHTSVVVRPQDNAATPSTEHAVLMGISPYLHDPDVSNTSFGQFTLLGYSSASDTFNTATSVASRSPPNTRAMIPSRTGAGSLALDSYDHRCTAMEIRISYSGTELQRSGVITAGLARAPSYGQNLYGSSVKTMNPIDGVFGTDGSLTSHAISVSDVHAQLVRRTTLRTEDGTTIVRWLPQGVPRYKAVCQSQDAISSSQRYDDPVILIMIRGDQTAAPSTFGNTYLVEIIAHWEISASNVRLHVAKPTPSPYDPNALAICLNAMESLSTVLDESHHQLDDERGGSASTSQVWEYAKVAYSGVSQTLGNIQDYAGTEQGRYVIGRLLDLGINMSRKHGHPVNRIGL